MSSGFDNEINKMAIVQLMRGNTAEYPITRPECVVFPDGTTASSRILDLEEGVNVMYLAYISGYEKYHKDNGNNPPMFKDKDTFHAYQSANLDSVKKSYESIIVKGVNNSLYDFYSYTTTEHAHSDAPTVQVEERPGEAPYNFNMKHFSSLMAGYAPKMIKMDTGYEPVEYDRFIFLDTVVLSAEEASDKFGTQQDESVKALKLVMGLSDPNADENNVCELYFCPSCKTQPFTFFDDWENVTIEDKSMTVYTSKCFITNPYIVEINQMGNTQPV